MVGRLSFVALLMGGSLVAFSPPSFAEDGGVVGPPMDAEQSQSAVEAYWTPERMQSAKPMPIPGKVGDPQSDMNTAADDVTPPGPPAVFPGWSPESDEPPPLPGEVIELNLDVESDTADDWLAAIEAQPQTWGTAPTNPRDGPYGPFQRWSMQGRYDTWPRAIHGKLFFTLGGSNFVCSGTVVNRNVVMSAGHCMSSGSGVAATNFLFCPGYNQTGALAGTGCWGVRSWRTSSSWFNSGDVDYDYSCLITNTTGTGFNGPIGNRTGWAGVAVNWSSFQPEMQFGYPAGAPFNGLVIEQVASTEWYEVDMTAGGQKSKYIGSDLTGGSSGGGWFLSWRHPSTEFPDTDGRTGTDPAGAQNGPYINGVNSHRRCRNGCGSPPTTTAGVFWQEMGSPQFLMSSASAQDAADVFQACVAAQ